MRANLPPLNDSVASTSRSGAFLWLVPAGVALAVRLLSIPTLVRNGRVHFFDPDSSYHFRRVWAALNSDGIVPLYDPALAYPHGAEPIWSPFYDQSMVLVSWVPYLIGDRFGVELTMAVLPVLISIALVRLFWNHVRQTWGWGPAMVSSLIVAVLPGLGQYSRFGNADHHALEALVAFGFFLAVGRAAGGPKSPTPPTTRTQVLLGLLIGAMVAYWVGLIVFLGAWGVWLLVMVVAGKIDSQRCRSFGISLLVATAFLALNFFVWGKRTVDPRLAFLSLTWSQAAMVAAAACLTFLCAARSRQARWAAALAAAGCTALSAWPMLGGSAWLLKTDPWLSIIDEFKSPFRLPGFAGPSWIPRELSLWMARWIPHELALWLLGSGTVLVFVAWRRRRDLSARLWPWLFSAQVLAMATLQGRFLHFAVVAEALICAELLGGITRRSLRWGVSGAVLLAALLHAQNMQWSGEGSPMTADQGLLEVLDWAREHTTLLGDPLMLDAKPEYGVLARWCLGPYILHYAQRPAVLTSHGNQVPGFREGHEPLLAESQNEALQLCKALGVRYILLGHSMAYAPYWARFSGRDPSNYVVPVRRKVGTATAVAMVPTARFFRTLAGRLMVFQGRSARISIPELPQGSVSLEAWPRFRRIAQSTAQLEVPILNLKLPEYQLFEVLESGIE